MFRFYIFALFNELDGLAHKTLVRVGFLAHDELELWQMVVLFATLDLKQKHKLN